ncbi:hypothetical protein GCM10010393_17800 [Streptomyces gobitricini]|uniref:Lipoprotein n=1 Tax=Streptomyces gobitricini TaxID=68211 RepID=A0ABP5Z1P3_9ACTN
MGTVAACATGDGPRPDSGSPSGRSSTTPPTAVTDGPTGRPSRGARVPDVPTSAWCAMAEQSQKTTCTRSVRAVTVTYRRAFYARRG